MWLAQCRLGVSGTTLYSCASLLQGTGHRIDMPLDIGIRCSYMSLLSSSKSATIKVKLLCYGLTSMSISLRGSGACNIEEQFDGKSLGCCKVQRLAITSYSVNDRWPDGGDLKDFSDHVTCHPKVTRTCFIHVAVDPLGWNISTRKLIE